MDVAQKLKVNLIWFKRYKTKVTGDIDKRKRIHSFLIVTFNHLIDISQKSKEIEESAYPKLIVDDASGAEGVKAHCQFDN